MSFREAVRDEWTVEKLLLQCRFDLIRRPNGVRQLVPGSNVPGSNVSLRAVELGRSDIASEVSLLTNHLVLPREGHLQQVYHIFAYLKAKQNRMLAFDPEHPEIEGFVQRGVSTSG